MPKGGRQPGAGRPKGSTKRPVFRDYFTEKEILEVVARAKEQCKTKPDILKMVIEQLFGKAPQTVDMNANVSIMPSEEVKEKVKKSIEIYLIENGEQDN